jgi:hypothetical protein
MTLYFPLEMLCSVWIQITKIKLLVTNRTKIMCKSEEMLGKINAQADKVTYAKERNGQR